MNPLSSINDYVWNVLRQELGWTKIDGKIPMLPTREQPQFDQQPLPYLLYSGSRETGRGDLSPLRLATVQYLIYAQDIPAVGVTPGKSSTSQINKAIEVLDNALNRLEESALDINRNAHDAANPRRAGLVGTHVTWTRVTNTETADPGSDEGGKARGFFSIRYEYTVAEREYKISF